MSRNTRYVEVRSIEYVPIQERRGRPWNLWPIWFTGGAHLATIATGAFGIAMGGNFVWMAIAVVLGTALGTFFMAFHSTQGPQLGLPQMIQSRPQFGYIGSLLVWVVALIIFIGYCAFNLVLSADTMLTLGAWNRQSTMVVVGLIAAVLALLGYDLIHKTQQWLAYVLIGIFAVATVALVRVDFPAGQLDFAKFALIPFLSQFLASAGYQLSWSVFVSDYSRYLPHNVGVRGSFWWTFAGAMIGSGWPALIGTVAAALFPALGLTAALKSMAEIMIPGSGDAFLVAALLGLVSASTLMLYSASLTLLSIADSFRPLRLKFWHRPATLVVLLLVTWWIALGSSKDFATQFHDFLAILLYLLTPWTAINLVDFYYLRRGHYSVREIFNPHGMYGRWNWRGLAAYFGGFIAMIPFFSTHGFRGPVAAALGGADLAILVGLPVATAIYLLAYRSFDLEEEIRLIAIADHQLDPDA